MFIRIIRQLRTGYGGLLKMNSAFASLGLKELLPMKIDVPDEGCIRTNSSQFCFQAGTNILSMTHYTEKYFLDERLEG